MDDGDLSSEDQLCSEDLSAVDENEEDARVFFNTNIQNRNRLPGILPFPLYLIRILMFKS